MRDARRVSAKNGVIPAKNRVPACFFAFAGYIISYLFLRKTGEMAERSKAAVSKTVNGFFPFGGSNPPLSAIFVPGSRTYHPILFPFKKTSGAGLCPDGITVFVWDLP